jgi:lysophospholipid acyltransferase (LPLAT)-like uncharacterized protein
LLGIAYAEAWALTSWDKFLLPRPFSRVRIDAIEVTASALEGETALPGLEAALCRLNPDAHGEHAPAAKVV